MSADRAVNDPLSSDRLPAPDQIIRYSIAILTRYHLRKLSDDAPKLTGYCTGMLLKEAGKVGWCAEA